jgi:mannitol-specific phosphotransferase system IIBC component
MKRKKLLELTMAAASEENYLELNNLIDKDPFDNLVNEISKTIKKKNK